MLIFFIDAENQPEYFLQCMDRPTERFHPTLVKGKYGRLRDRKADDSNITVQKLLPSGIAAANEVKDGKADILHSRSYVLSFLANHGAQSSEWLDSTSI